MVHDPVCQVGSLGFRSTLVVGNSSSGTSIQGGQPQAPYRLGCTPEPCPLAFSHTHLPCNLDLAPGNNSHTQPVLNQSRGLARLHGVQASLPSPFEPQSQDAQDASSHRLYKSLTLEDVDAAPRGGRLMERNILSLPGVTWGPQGPPTPLQRHQDRRGLLFSHKTQNSQSQFSENPPSYFRMFLNVS